MLKRCCWLRVTKSSFRKSPQIPLSMTSKSVQYNTYLRYLPDDTRSRILDGLLTELQQKHDVGLTLLCTALIGNDNDTSSTRAQETLVDILTQQVINGQVDVVLNVVKSSVWLKDLLLKRFTKYLNGLEDMGGRNDSTALETTQAKKIGNIPVVNIIGCARRMLQYNDTSTEVQTQLLSICLRLVRTHGRVIAAAAKDTISTLLRDEGVIESHGHNVFVCSTEHLLAVESSKTQKTIGYFLWLQLLSSPSLLRSFMCKAPYWDLIANGLLFGDNEKRKLCLEILRLSVVEAATNGAADMLTTHAGQSPTQLIAQYTRYCTVFETLALARYSNLLLETERDLNMLASSTSLVHERWLYVLLRTAFAIETQDQNRRVVGGWILYGTFSRSRTSIGFAEFLETSFLPWVTEGHLFVSTMKLAADHKWQCKHGQRLSYYIQELFKDTDTEDSSRLLDIFLQYLLSRRSDLFAHAAVYIMDGLIQSCKDTGLTTEQVEHLLELAEWQRVPEVAKDFIRRCCHDLIKDSVDSIPTRLHDRWVALRDRYGACSESSTGVSSERDKKVQQSLEKCRIVISQETTYETSALCDMLDDIWSDAEYLVYPRELLTTISALILHPRIITRALQSDGDQLSSFISITTQRLLNLAETRSFLLEPLIRALRRAVLTQPDTTRLLNLLGMVLQIAGAPPSPKTDVQFEYATSTLLQARFPDNTRRIFNNNESHAIATYIDFVSRLDGQQDILLSIIQSIIARWKRVKIPPPTISSFKTTTQLRVLILCCEQIQDLNAAGVSNLVNDLLYLLSIEPLPQYRYLLSWTAIRLLIRNPAEHEKLFTLMDTKDHHSNPKYLAALIKLAIELAGTADVDQTYAVRLAATFIAFAASSKVVIRHEAQWSFPQLMDLARAKDWSQIYENPAYSSLDSYIRGLPRFDEPPTDRANTQFDPQRQNTMTWLLEGSWSDFDHSGPPLARREDLLWLYEQDKQQNLSIPAACLSLGDAMEMRTPTTIVSKARPPISLTAGELDETIALQTKGSAYLKHIMDDEETKAGRTHQLIVLGSLVTNPYNLGGLSRVSEIFGAKALCVGDPKVIKEKDFTSVAVSSHNHIEILPLPQDDITAFLKDKKADGWTVVGVEQTDRSDVLGMPGTRLPEKTILVIGNEREGMPGTVIGECDVLIEIPQRGVTRSMNVQTVAAVVLYEFNRQHSR